MTDVTMLQVFGFAVVFTMGFTVAQLDNYFEKRKIAKFKTMTADQFNEYIKPHLAVLKSPDRMTQQQYRDLNVLQLELRRRASILDEVRFWGYM